jgi:hypothetical protein
VPDGGHTDHERLVRSPDCRPGGHASIGRDSRDLSHVNAYAEIKQNAADCVRHAPSNQRQGWVAFLSNYPIRQ